MTDKYHFPFFHSNWKLTYEITCLFSYVSDLSFPLCVGFYYLTIICYLQLAYKQTYSLTAGALKSAVLEYDYNYNKLIGNDNGEVGLVKYYSNMLQLVHSLDPVVFSDWSRYPLPTLSHGHATCLDKKKKKNNVKSQFMCNLTSGNGICIPDGAC